MSMRKKEPQVRVTNLSDEEFLIRCKTILPPAMHGLAGLSDVRHALAGVASVATFLLREADRRMGVTT